MKRLTRQIHIGAVPVGGDAPCSVQSMCSTDTRDIAATGAQIAELAAVGCEIVRCAVPDADAARALAQIKRNCPIPVVADIHFDYKLALDVLEGGIDGLRLNPGNIANFDLSNPEGGTGVTAGGPMRCLRVVVNTGGQIRVCAPALPNTNPQGC